MAPIATGNVPPVDRISAPSSKQSIEEVCFSAGLICLDGHFHDEPAIPGPLTQDRVAGIVARTLEKTHSRKDVREALARNVEVWVYLTRIFNNAIDSLSLRCFAGMPGSAYDDKASTDAVPNGSSNSSINGSHGHGHAHTHTHVHTHAHAHSHIYSLMGHDSPELIILHHGTLKEDLQILNKLMHIARNMLVCSVPKVPQDICAAVSFDSVVFQVIVLCVNIVGKGYHGDVLDDVSRSKLNEIYDLFKKLLVTSLQQVHNWTAKNDRNKMAFWYYIFFEDDTVPEELETIGGDGTGYRPDLARVELEHWLERNASLCTEAHERLVDYASTHQNKAPGMPSLNSPLARLWIPNHLLDPGLGRDQAKYDHDEAFGRVSHENEIWWERVSDPNRDEWRLPMPDRAYGKRRQSFLKHILPHRFSPRWRMRDEDAAQGHTIHMTGEYFRVPGNGDARLDSLIEEFGGSDEDEDYEDGDEDEGELGPGDGNEDAEADVRNDKEDHEDGEGGGEDDEHHDHEHDHDHDHGHGRSCHRYHHHHHHHHDHDHDHHHHHHDHDHDDEEDHEGPYLDANGNPLDEYDDNDDDLDDEDDEDDEDGHHHHHGQHSDRDDRDDLDNDIDSYGEGPALGIVTEIPNILDPKQIEALHMIIKSCILDTMGCGLTPHGESLQQARCKYLMASDIGRSLLRELLVFIAVWDQEESSLIWELTSQILEAIHDASLLPYAWTELRIPKDVVSPAQAVMLRMINYFFRKKYLGQNAPPTASNGAPPRQRVDARDMRLVHFLVSSLRCRMVPECLAFMSVQCDIRRGNTDGSVFPIETWDMERARDGLSQVLELFATIAGIEEIRAKLVDWELAAELVALLKGLEEAIPKKPLVDAVPHRNSNVAAAAAGRGAAAAGAARVAQQPLPPPPPQAPVPPPIPTTVQEPAYKFPWAGIKTQVLSILATLLQPEPGRSSPGNRLVQNQIMEEKGMLALLNACVYDDHNRFARERVQICLKYLMDGCEEANMFVRELVKSTPMPASGASGPGQGQQAPANGVRRVRVDGVEGEIKVRVRSEGTPSAPGAAGPAQAPQALPALAAPPVPQAARAQTTPVPQAPVAAPPAVASPASTASSISHTVAEASPPSVPPPAPTPGQSHGTPVLPSQLAVAPTGPPGTARQRKQRQKRQQRQQRLKVQEAQDALGDQAAQEGVAQQPQAQAQAQQSQQALAQAQATPQHNHHQQKLKQAQTAQPATSTPRVFGPPPPPPPIAPALASLAAQMSQLTSLPTAHLFQPNSLGLTPALAGQIGMSQQQPPTGKMAETLAARRARCESLLGEIVSLSDHTARMAVSMDRGEMPLPEDTLMNFVKSQKFLDRCRERLTRPVSGAPDALVEEGSNLTSSMLADPLGSLFSGLGVPSSDQEGAVAMPPTSLEDQYRLVEQALLYLTEDLAKNPDPAHQQR
ncbi:hypothetical protein SCUCBS95973_005010 [Sporothrix curviconia]|uniref:Ataxin-10 homolog n=1 Tax=Sporothrix curviconia TaxID=1260050 RepID=A0ABP0BTL9_9PEZI